MTQFDHDLLLLRRFAGLRGLRAGSVGLAGSRGACGGRFGKGAAERVLQSARGRGSCAFEYPLGMSGAFINAHFLKHGRALKHELDQLSHLGN